jgi:transposase
VKIEDSERATTMAMRRESEVQGELVVTWAEMPRSPGHVFYDRLQKLLGEAGFDVFVEETSKPFYAPRMGAPSLPPGRYFRMHMIGYFEGIDSERGIVWRCSDSLSLREFLRLANRDKVPDHSWLSKTRSRLPHEVHEKVFEFVLKLVAERGLLKGERIGVDGSTMEANAAMRSIVRRDTGETYRELLTRMAEESGVETPTIDDLIRLDRGRKGKKLSNEDWMSKTDPDSKIAKMKDGSTHLAYKPEHAVDLDTGIIVAAPIHAADEGDTATLDPTLAAAEKNLAPVGCAPTPEDPCDLAADKGYHSRDVLKDLDNSPWKTRIAEPRPSKGYLRWHGDDEARAAVYANRNRLRSGVGKEAMRKRGEVVERSFAHVLERGGMRRAWLRGRENVHKRYLVHVAGYNLGVLMRALFGAGTPREAAGAWNAFVFVIQAAQAIVVVVVAACDAQIAALVIAVAPDPT